MFLVFSNPSDMPEEASHNRNPGFTFFETGNTMICLPSDLFQCDPYPLLKIHNLECYLQETTQVIIILSALCFRESRRCVYYSQCYLSHCGPLWVQNSSQQNHMPPTRSFAPSL